MRHRHRHRRSASGRAYAAVPPDRPDRQTEMRGVDAEPDDVAREREELSTPDATGGTVDMPRRAGTATTIQFQSAPRGSTHNAQQRGPDLGVLSLPTFPCRLVLVLVLVL